MWKKEKEDIGVTDRCDITDGVGREGGIVAS